MTYGLGVVHTDEEKYRQEWATLTGRSPSEIYIPEGLREKGERQPSEGSADTEGRGV